jgi:hypothetical protein
MMSLWRILAERSLGNDMKLVHLALWLPLLSCSGGDDHSHGADSGHDCSKDSRGEEYQPAMQKVGEASYAISLMDANPAPPARGDNVWKVEVRDADGTPVEGKTIEIKTFMPDHQHGSPIVPTITEEGSGMYTIDPVNLFMGGYWEITVSAVDPGATESPDDDVDLDSVIFKFCIDS